MLLILKHPVGRAVVLLVPGAQRNCGARTPREWEWVPCPGACQLLALLSSASLPAFVSLCTLSLARAFLHFPRQVSFASQWNVGGGGGPGDHLPCFQAANVLTASLPGKFKMHL